jgi:hypothetical protein
MIATLPLLERMSTTLILDRFESAVSSLVRSTNEGTTLIVRRYRKNYPAFQKSGGVVMTGEDEFVGIDVEGGKIRLLPLRVMSDYDVVLFECRDQNGYYLLRNILHSF